MTSVMHRRTYLLSGLGRCACGGALIAMSRHHGRRRGYFYGCAYNWKRGPTVCRNNLHLPQAVLETAVLETVAAQLDPHVVAAAVAEARRRLEETARHRGERRLALEHELRLVRAREQRLAEAIAQGREPNPRTRRGARRTPHRAGAPDRLGGGHPARARAG